MTVRAFDALVCILHVHVCQFPRNQTLFKAHSMNKSLGRSNTKANVDSSSLQRMDSSCVMLYNGFGMLMFMLMLFCTPCRSYRGKRRG